MMSEVYNSIPVLCTVNDIPQVTVTVHFNTTYPHEIMKTICVVGEYIGLSKGITSLVL
jgi:hypothetical protein